MKDVSEYIENNKRWLIDKMIEIVSANTINTPPYGNENNGQKIIENIFKNMGLEIDRFSPDEVPGFKEDKIYLKGRDYRRRDNLVGFVGKGKKKTLIFNGHIDTVPSQNFEWKIAKPFEPKFIDGKIYGLGACDMKGGIISSIFALKSIIDLDISIEGKVVIESVVDEEFGGGNGSLACVKKGYKGDFAIISEPTSMDICITNVSSAVAVIKITGDSGLKYFASETEGVNSILLASGLINALKDYEDFLNSLKNKYDMYKKIDKPIKFLFSDIKAGEIGCDKIITTPKECLIRIYTMNYPDVGEDKFTDMMLLFLKKYPDIYKYFENGQISFIKKYRFVEGGSFDLNTSDNKDFINKIMQNANRLTGRKLNIGASLGGTDFFAFSNYGNTPAVVFGPGGGNCHAPDEYVNLKDLLDLSKIYAALIYDYCC